MQNALTKLSYSNSVHFVTKLPFSYKTSCG